ncbi:hypothetical protein EDC04DRAFT_2772314 [Pisolithus marmoratus]|nr:hypothetical protein EDC04DRAFT_2772314 [Pisolithus marmoratus]
MAEHQCIDWSRSPPARKLDVLVLSHGDTHVYAIIPKLYKDLDRLAREEFNLGDADLEFYSSCIKLCNVGVPARIGEHVWEYISSLIGCVFVIAREPTRKPARESEATSHPTPPPPAQPIRTPTEPELPMNEEERHDNLYLSSDRVNGEGPPEYMDLPTDQGNIETREETGNGNPGRSHVASPVEDTRTTDDEWEGAGPVPRKRRSRQPLENPQESEEEEPAARRRRIVKAGQEESSPSSSGQFGTRRSSSRIRKRMSMSPTKPGRETAGDPESMDLLLFDSQKRRSSHSQSKSLRDEKTIVNTPSTPRKAPEPTPVFTQATRGTQQEGQERIYIIVAHRPSKQESKFAVKASTRVSKVISSVCKSFDLDNSHAKLLLIVDTTEEDGIMENLFPCDVDDSMMRAGAEPNSESKFLLMLPTDP